MKWYKKFIKEEEIDHDQKGVKFYLTQIVKVKKKVAPDWRSYKPKGYYMYFYTNRDSTVIREFIEEDLLDYVCQGFEEPEELPMGDEKAG
jgi:hypothetical protein